MRKKAWTHHAQRAQIQSTAERMGHILEQQGGPASLPGEVSILRS